jgi:hypothetical protein
MDVNVNDNTINDNSNSKSNVDAKISKQLRHYYKHKNKINKNKRKQYNDNKITNSRVSKDSKTKHKKQKPRDSKNYSFYYNLRKKIEQYSDSKPVLSLNSLLVIACTKLVPTDEYFLNPYAVTASIFARPSLVEEVLAHDGQYYYELKTKFPTLSARQLQRNLQKLVKDKWLVRWGRGNFTNYYPNPFLLALYRRDKQYVFLGEYSRLNLNFFDLLNIPLIGALNQNVTLAETKFSSYVSQDAWVKAFFEGQITVKLQTDVGIFETILPVNLHAANKLNGSKIVGKDKKTKENIVKTVTNPFGFPHHTLPLAWCLFDILESSEYQNGSTYIHFDNSFKILKYESAKNSWGNWNYLNFKKPFEKLLENVWSTKNCQYVEVSDFDLLKRLFHERFVNQKRRKDLFDALGIEIKSKKHLTLRMQV